MAEHTARTLWRRGDAVFSDNRYSRAHVWQFDGGVEVRASASPHIVRLPYSDPNAVDPEEAFIASLSSCHLLVFLSIAVRRGYVVDEYVDDAAGHLEKNEHGKMWVSRVTLRPKITFSGAAPSADQLREMHEEAHHECFIANSVKTHITCEPPSSS